MQKAKVTVYLTQACPFCLMARELLDSKAVEYEVIDLSQDPDRQATTSAILPGHTTVPLVLIDGDAIGGYTELAALQSSGDLDRRLFD